MLFDREGGYDLEPFLFYVQLCTQSYTAEADDYFGDFSYYLTDTGRSLNSEWNWQQMGSPGFHNAKWMKNLILPFKDMK